MVRLARGISLYLSDGIFRDYLVSNPTFLKEQNKKKKEGSDFNFHLPLYFSYICTTVHHM